ncbi:MAG: zinc dependent phospholipase C family protein [Acidobacteriota bacterium]|nr:zinc dependent phospholipase C family protein [Acidobacteriota bacterium]
MRIAASAFIGLAVLVFTSGSPSAWGFDVHRFITNAAMDAMPEPIRPFFQKHRKFIAEHSIDPDLMRTYGVETEDPNHFLDMDGVAPDPFTGIPRDEAAYIQMLGAEKAKVMGRVPWRVEEVYARLVEAFKPQEGRTISASTVTALSAILSHYVEDAHVPFHAALNYDGQATNQRGIHSRFESELFARFKDRITIAPVLRAPVLAPRDYIFEKLIEGNRMVPAILASDKAAIEGREFYDKAYYKAFFGGGAQPIVERRINEAIGGVAAVIAGAWEKAGKPALPMDDTRAPARIRR